MTGIHLEESVVRATTGRPLETSLTPAYKKECRHEPTWVVLGDFPLRPLRETWIKRERVPSGRGTGTENGDTRTDEGGSLRIPRSGKRNMSWLCPYAWHHHREPLWTLLHQSVKVKGSGIDDAFENSGCVGAWKVQRDSSTLSNFVL